MPRRNLNQKKRFHLKGSSEFHSWRTWVAQVQWRNGLHFMCDTALIGIDTGVHPKEGWARGTLIQRWLHLIVHYYLEYTELERQRAERNSAS